MLTSPEPVIEVAGLHKRFGPVVAVDDISFTVRAGEVFGVVGSNGAGKTTTLECILGLIQPDAGTVRVLGLDPARQGEQVRLRVGAQPQAAQLPPRLRVREALVWFASLYPRTQDPDALLRQWGLETRRSAAVGDLSGGERQRLFITLALLHEPEIVCFDELTTGLDPRARRDTWRAVEALRAGGRTVLVVTHDMEEAERLCDRVAVFDAGRVAALGRPADLVDDIGAESLEDVFLARTGRQTEVNGR